jgi:hypothetical protein
MPEERSKARACWEKTCDYISLLSIGKYSTKLYHRGRSDYSCCASGLFTAGLLLVILLASISILSTTFSRSVRTLTETTSLLSESPFFNMTLYELELLGIAPPLVRTIPLPSNVSCDSFKMTIELVHNGVSVHNFTNVSMIKPAITNPLDNFCFFSPRDDTPDYYDPEFR